ncbi:hypothetical protein [Streptomyces sp. 049-1]|uniref:hypothetical protein n=1 Tax=Streptomyces sp. 049-1 TaxID=2789264 RepID=UPI0039818762
MKLIRKLEPRCFPAGRRLLLAVLAAVTVVTVNPGVASAATVRIECTIPAISWSYTVCSGPFTVLYAETVKLRLDTSGGKNVEFCVEPEGGGRDFYCAGGWDPGQTRSLWTNDTGFPQRVQVIANHGYEVDVRATGEAWTVK